MVSEIFRNLEDKSMELQSIHDDLAAEISHKLQENKENVEQALFKTCITTSARAIDVAFIVNEFLVHFQEAKRLQENNGMEKDHD